MLCPNIALFQDQINEIAAQLRITVNTLDFTWFARRGIQVLNKNSYWLLNKTSELNHWNRFCNSTILKKSGELCSMPIIHLHNLDSPECCVTYSDSDLVQKIGGEMVCVFWPTRLPHSRILHNESTLNLLNYEHIFSKLNFTINNSDHCYTFQIYQNEAYLVGGRHTFSMWEDTEEELDITAAKMQAKRPKRFKCSGLETIKELLTEYHDEIFIVRDKQTGERVNVYLKIGQAKHLQKGRYKRLVPYWLHGEHNHIIAQYPHTKAKYIALDEAAAKLRSQIQEAAVPWRTLHLSGDGLAESLKVSNIPSRFHKIIIRLQKFNTERWDDVIIDWLKKMQAKQLIEILQLKD